MNGTRALAWRALTSGAFLFILAEHTWGHNGEGRPTPPTMPPLPALTERIITPPRWSWIHWWEANRDPYLFALRQGDPDQGPGQEVLARRRGEVVKALLEAARSNDARVRRAAALSLGRMGETAAQDVLKQLDTQDPSEDVRAAARVAMGLLDTPEAEAILLGQASNGQAATHATFIALGIVTRVSEKGQLFLRDGLVRGEPGVATLALWTMNFHRADGEAVDLRQVLTGSQSVWLASDAMIALGGLGDAKWIGPLSDVLLETEQAKSLAAYKVLQSVEMALFQHLRAGRLRQKEFGKEIEKYRQDYEKYRKDLESWNKRNNPGGFIPAPKEAVAPEFIKVTIGLERVYISQLRASAAIALGRIDHPASRAALRKALEEKDDEYSDLFKGFAIISLGQLGDAQALPTFVEMLDPGWNRPVRKSSENINSPLRGYAAVALGLYARARQTPQGPQLNPDAEKVCQFLAERLADPKETDEVRSAAAMGLGLTGRTENLRLLQQAGKTVGIDHPIVVGYTILARGMLSDRNMLPAAKLFLDARKDAPDVDVAGVLSRRAAVLGVGLTHSDEAIPILADAWHLNYYANREVALAYAVSESYGATEPLLKLLANPKEGAQEFAAQCLGEIYAARRPSRLARLTNGSNYTVKNLKRAYFARMANEFLFDYLIAAFGEDWR